MAKKDKDTIDIIFGVSALPVGAVMLFLGLIIMTGNPVSAGTLVVYSIVCTLGVSLLIWLPLAWLVGAVTLMLFFGIAKVMGFSVTTIFPVLNRPVGEVFQPAVSRATVHQQGLINYIQKAQAKGFSTSQIHKRLRLEGWEQTEIEQAQAAIEASG